MARPMTHDDLPSYEREGRQVIRIASDQLTRLPLKLAERLLGVLAESSNHPDQLEVDPDHGTVTRIKTTAELDEMLRAAQIRWDELDKKYHDAAAGARDIQEWEKRSVNRHAENEGYDPINWDWTPDEPTSYGLSMTVTD